MKLLRSLLNTPGNRPKMLDKAPACGADALIFDLEDSVPIEQKPEARAIVREYIDKLKRANVIFVRVNPLETGLLRDDLEAVVCDGLGGISLPKVESPEIVRAVDVMLAEVERARGLPVGSTELLLSLETARGIEYAREIVTAASRIGSVSIGTAENGDLQTDLGCLWSPEGIELLYARSRVVVAARAAGIQCPLDGVYPDYHDEAGLIADARMGRRLGFRGKKLIHPNQVEPVNRIFTPTEKEIDYCRRVIAALDAAMAQGFASTTLDGKMIDIANIANARQVLAWAEHLAAR